MRNLRKAIDTINEAGGEVKFPGKPQKSKPTGSKSRGRGRARVADSELADRIRRMRGTDADICRRLKREGINISISTINRIRRRKDGYR